MNYKLIELARTKSPSSISIWTTHKSYFSIGNRVARISTPYWMDIKNIIGLVEWIEIENKLSLIRKAGVQQRRVAFFRKNLKRLPRSKLSELILQTFVFFYFSFLLFQSWTKPANKSKKHAWYCFCAVIDSTYSIISGNAVEKSDRETNHIDDATNQLESLTEMKKIIIRRQQLNELEIHNA